MAPSQDGSRLALAGARLRWVRARNIFLLQEGLKQPLSRHAGAPWGYGSFKGGCSVTEKVVSIDMHGGNFKFVLVIKPDI